MLLEQVEYTFVSGFLLHENDIRIGTDDHIGYGGMAGFLMK